MDKLLEGNFYHIYNRGNNGEKIFYKPENYLYFLQKFDFYLSKYLEVYAFCLMQNHFHFLVRVKDLPGFQNLAGLISKQFSNFFNSYTKSINKQQNRHGSLFEKPFKRKLITDEKYLFRVICYIHSNPTHHNLVENLTDWPYSSYKSILDSRETKLKRQEVIKLFNGRENYLLQHQNKLEIDLIDQFIIE